MNLLFVLPKIVKIQKDGFETSFLKLKVIYSGVLKTDQVRGTKDLALDIKFY